MIFFFQKKEEKNSFSLVFRTVFGIVYVYSVLPFVLLRQKGGVFFD
jgi:hypothetical protein